MGKGKGGKGGKGGGLVRAVRKSRGQAQRVVLVIRTANGRFNGSKPSKSVGVPVMAPETYQRLAEACESLSCTYAVPSPPLDDQAEVVAFLAEALVAVVAELPKNGMTAGTRQRQSPERLQR